MRVKTISKRQYQLCIPGGKEESSMDGGGGGGGGGGDGVVSVWIFSCTELRHHEIKIKKINEIKKKVKK